MAEVIETVTALGAALGVVLAVSGVLGLLCAVIGVCMDWLDFDPQDRWDGEE